MIRLSISRTFHFLKIWNNFVKVILCKAYKVYRRVNDISYRTRLNKSRSVYLLYQFLAAKALTKPQPISIKLIIMHPKVIWKYELDFRGGGLFHKIIFEKSVYSRWAIFFSRAYGIHFSTFHGTFPIFSLWESYRIQIDHLKPFILLWATSCKK